MMLWVQRALVHFIFEIYWDIVAKVEFSSCQKKRLNSLNYSSNVVVLIPKILEANKTELFRPIVLANVKFKIITPRFWLIG